MPRGTRRADSRDRDGGAGDEPGRRHARGTATVAAVAGVASFANLSIDKSGTGYTLTASATGSAAATSGAFNITPGTATQLVYTVQPTTTTAGATITPAVQVTARDAHGNTASGFTGTVAVAIGTNPGGGTLAGRRRSRPWRGWQTLRRSALTSPGRGTRWPSQRPD